MSETVSAIIVDDEALARQVLRELLARDSRVEVVAECAGGREAIASLRLHDPDLVFLDIQMPEVTGFDVLTEFQDRMPTTIMVTAYDKYAIRAFEYHALDYLLKPIDERRFAVALDRGIQRARERRQGRRLAGFTEFVSALTTGATRPDRIVLKASGSLLFLEPKELEWIEAAKNYVRVHVGAKTYVVRDTIAGVLERLDPAVFMRVHRACIVNRMHVREIRPVPGGADHEIVLRDGTILAIGRSHRDDVRRALGQ